MSENQEVFESSQLNYFPSDVVQQVQGGDVRSGEATILPEGEELEIKTAEPGAVCPARPPVPEVPNTGSSSILIKPLWFEPIALQPPSHEISDRNDYIAVGGVALLFLAWIGLVSYNMAMNIMDENAEDIYQAKIKAFKILSLSGMWSIIAAVGVVTMLWKFKEVFDLFFLLMMVIITITDIFVNPPRRTQDSQEFYAKFMMKGGNLSVCICHTIMMIGRMRELEFYKLFNKPLRPSTKMIVIVAASLGINAILASTTMLCSPSGWTVSGTCVNIALFFLTSVVQAGTDLMMTSTVVPLKKETCFYRKNLIRACWGPLSTMMTPVSFMKNLPNKCQQMSRRYLPLQALKNRTSVTKAANLTPDNTTIDKADLFLTSLRISIAAVSLLITNSSCNNEFCYDIMYLAGICAISMAFTMPFMVLPFVTCTTRGGYIRD